MTMNKQEEILNMGQIKSYFWLVNSEVANTKCDFMVCYNHLSYAILI